MDKETRGFDVELFANVLADLSQIMSSLAAGTRFRFVEMFDSRQMIGQRLTTSTRTGCAGQRRFSCNQCRLLGQFGFGGRQITDPGFLKKISLLNRQGFAMFKNMKQRAVKIMRNSTNC